MKNNHSRFFNFLFACVILFGCTGNDVQTRSKQFDPEVPLIIDAHVHFRSFSDKRLKFAPTDEMVKELEDAGIYGAIAHLQSVEENQMKILREKTKIKFAVCAAVMPEQAIAEVEAGLKSGQYQCLKVYLGYVPKYAYDEFYKPFYHLAEQYNVPVVFHTGDTYDKMAYVKYAHPLQIDEVAVDFPSVKFVIAHMGTPWTRSAAQVVYKNDNVYVDTSAILIGDLTKASKEKIEKLLVDELKWFFLYVENPKKILFGTDWPLTDHKPYIEAHKKAIPKEYWNDIFYNNAAELFKLK